MAYTRFALHGAILQFQQEKGLVGTAIDPGAGRIGPMTKKALQAEWNRRHVALTADKISHRASRGTGDP